MAELSAEELARLEEQVQMNSVGIKQTKDFTSPEALYEDLIGSIRKYHPSTDISLVEKAYRIAGVLPLFCALF